MRCVHATSEKTAGLHHLMSGVMHGSGCVIAGAHETELVGDLCMHRQDLGDLKGIALGANRFERAANLTRRIRLHVPQVLLTWRTEVEDHDAGLVALLWIYLAFCLKLGKAGHRQANGAQSTRGKEITTCDAIAGRDSGFIGEGKHRRDR